MGTNRTQSTAVNNAAAQAQSPDPSHAELLTLYLAATVKQREAHFADTARAAEIAGLSRRTIQLWIDIGLLQALRIGRNYRVSLDSLRGYLESQIDK
jgi:excisionase family DNA binding protein